MQPVDPIAAHDSCAVFPAATLAGFETKATLAVIGVVAGVVGVVDVTGAALAGAGVVAAGLPVSFESIPPRNVPIELNILPPEPLA